MSTQNNFYQRIFRHDLPLPTLTNHQSRYTIMRRNCSDRLCLLMIVFLLFYIGWYVLTETDFTSLFRRNSVEQLAYKNAIKTSSPMITNTQLCSADEIHLLFLIISSSSNFLERQSIRETWGSISDVVGVRSQRLFVIGYQSGKNFYQDISKEAAHEQDILYLPINDRSVTIKELHAYRWLEKYCSKVAYIFKTEDDLFVNSILLHEIVRELRIKPTEIKNRHVHNVSLDLLFAAQIAAHESQFLFGWAFLPGLPERKLTASPYYVTHQEYPYELYPRYCSGFGYLMNAKTRNAITHVAFEIQQPFRLSDIFITGIIPQKLNFICENLPFTFHQGTMDQCLDLLRNKNKKVSSSSSPPVIICSTGRHLGQSSFSDYQKLWSALKSTYGDRLNPSNN